MIYFDSAATTLQKPAAVPAAVALPPAVVLPAAVRACKAFKKVRT